jgi:DNA-binding transcriptional MerR regulator
MTPKAARTYLSIGEVLSLLRVDFPDVTISKIRFLEGQGLVSPERTSSGYRKFHEADVERLRFVLRHQREHFLPLKVIRERMEEAGLAPAAPTKPPGARRKTVSELVAALQEPPPTVAAAPEEQAETEQPAASELAPPPKRRAADEPGTGDDVLPAKSQPAAYSDEELAAAAGIDVASVEALVTHQLISPATVGGVESYDEDAVAIAKAASGFFALGLEPRHLKVMRHGVDREIGMIEALVLPMLQTRTPEGRVRARDEAAQFARLGQSLRAALLRRDLRRLLG